MKKLIPVLVICLIACKHKLTQPLSDKTNVNKSSFYKNKEEKLTVYKPNDSATYFIYSDLLYKNTECPDKMLWGKLEYCNAKQITVVDSENISSSYINKWISSYIYEYSTVPFSKRDINDSIANSICDLLESSFGFIPLDYNTKNKDMVHYVNKNLKETSVYYLYWQSYTPTDSFGEIYLNDNDRSDTMFLLDVLINKDILLMKKTKHSLPTERIKAYVNYIDEMDLLNSGYRNDIIELVRTIKQYG